MVKSPSFDRLLIFPLNDHTSMFICDSYRRSRMCLSELTLQLVEEFGSWGRPFAFPLSFSSQVIGMTAHQVPTADIMMNSSTEQKLSTHWATELLDVHSRSMPHLLVAFSCELKCALD